MSTQRKPRADSPLKTLPVPRQAAIAEYLQTHTLVETQGWLAADGVKTSVTALSEFGSWYALRQQLLRNESTVETLQEDFKQRNPQATAAELSAIGQSFFAALALNQQDAEAWVQVQNLNLKTEQISLDREKLEFLKAKAAQAEQTDKVLSDAELTPEQRAQRIKEIYGRS